VAPRGNAGRLGTILGLGLLLLPAVPARGPAGTTSEGAPGRDAAALERGLELFADKCASCHGATGRGDGPAAYLLYPRPRDLGSGTFRVVSGEEVMPTDADLRRTIARGMPGSAMPPWGHLPEADLDALVEAVRHYMVEARVTEYMTLDELPRDEALEETLYDLDPGDVVEVPDEPPVTPEHLARGRELYDANCAHCHDEDGRGLERRDLVDSEGMPIFARDFTKGVFKGGSDGPALARRIALGMPGTPMPQTPYPGEDLWAIVHYVQTMIDEGAAERVSPRRSTLVARRVEAPLGVDPFDPVWSRAESTWIALMPLWWRFERVEGVRVSALHDGRRLALRLSWDDPTEDDELVGHTRFGDAVAVQLSGIEDPPFFGMGAAGREVDLWQWKAAWQRDLRDGWVSLADVYADMPTEREHAFPAVPADLVFDTARAANNLLSRTEHVAAVEAAAAEGLGTLTSRAPADQDVRGGGTWHDGAWHVVFARELGGDGRGGTVLLAGGRASVAFAVWNGDAGDRDGQKAVSIWHELELEE